MMRPTAAQAKVTKYEDAEEGRMERMELKESVFIVNNGQQTTWESIKKENKKE
jgi:hypothetical protein